MMLGRHQSRSVRANDVTRRLCLWLFCAYSAATLAAAPVRRLAADIPPSPLAKALQDFAHQTAIQVMYESRLVDGRRSAGAKAGQSEQDALRSLLAGAGLRHEFLNSTALRLLPERAASASPPSRAAVLSPAPAPPPADASLPNLDQVIVSANRRDEPLHSVAMSALVFSEREIEVAGIRTVGEIAARTPGLQYGVNSQLGPGIMTNMVIRGMSAERGTLPTVGMYIGDVPIQNTRLALYNAQPLIFDLARVEVLRGHQETLHGSYAQSGAVRYVMNEASTTETTGFLRSEMSATDGGDLGAEVGIALGGPLQYGRVGARINALVRRDGGYVDRVDPFTGAVLDRDANRAVSQLLRLGLMYESENELRIAPTLHYQSIRRHDTPIIFVDTPSSSLSPSPFHTEWMQNGKLLRQPYDDRLLVGSLRIEKHLSAARVTALTSWYQRQADATVDKTNIVCLVFFGSCGNPQGPAYPSDRDQAVVNYLSLAQSAFRQELRLMSASASARVDWQVGLQYTRGRAHRTSGVYLVVQPESPVIAGADYVTSSVVDAYARVQIALSRQWTLAAGTRFSQAAGSFHSREYSVLHPDSEAVIATDMPYETQPEAPRAELSYRPNERNFFYLNVGRSSRPGGEPPVGQCNGVPLPRGVRSDAVWSHELGMKNVWFDHRLQLDASVYYLNWRDPLIRVQDDCGNSYHFNGGRVVGQGFDLAAQWQSAGLTLRTALGHTSIRYRQIVHDTTGKVLAERGAVAIDTPQEATSPWKFSATLQYERSIGQQLTAYWRAEQLYASRNSGPYSASPELASVGVAVDSLANPAIRQLDLQFGLLWRSAEMRLAVSNLTNARPRLNVDADGLNSGLVYGQTLRPRTLALSITHRI